MDGDRCADCGPEGRPPIWKCLMCGALVCYDCAPHHECGEEAEGE